MVVDVRYNNEVVAVVNYENGPDKMNVQLFAPPGGQQKWSFSLDEFTNHLLKAKELLKKCAEEDEKRNKY